jgi:hypothetical protein
VSQYVIKVEGFADGRPCPVEQQYLVWYDPDVPHDYDQMGEFSADITRAKRFPDAMSALEEWKRIRTVDPVRPWDGKLNRPLTAFTIVVESVP